MYKCVIIDDDQHAIDGLAKYIGAFPGLRLIDGFTDPFMALTALANAEMMDVIFMDIDMPKISGIELSKEIRHKTRKLIFTTGHTEYAYEAFKINADDYLLKPFTQGEFMISMNKVLPDDKGLSRNDFFFVRNKEENHKTVNIKYKDVIVVESQRNCVLIHTTSKEVLTYMSLNEISKLFKEHPDFAQFHRSFIISYQHIDYIYGNSIRMTNGVTVTVGDYYRKSFTDFLTTHLIKAKRKT